MEINSTLYDAVGNIGILMVDHRETVHVRRAMVEASEHGDSQPLRDYMNSCILAARKGAVMVSPFISPQERDVLTVLLKEEHPIILLADNGFGEYYKPSNLLFDAVAEGKLLIICPWKYDPKKKHITRNECITLNDLAAAIAAR